MNRSLRSSIFSALAVTIYLSLTSCIFVETKTKTKKIPQKQTTEVGGVDSTGGGEVHQPTREQIIKSINESKELLKDSSLFSVMINSNQLKDRSFLKTHIHLLDVIQPGHDFSEERYNKDGYIKPAFFENHLAKMIDEISIDLYEDKPCKAKNNHSAMARVSEHNWDATICFSISLIESKTTLSSYRADILGLWFHELAHMAGHEEEVANKLQKLAITAFHFLIKDESQISSRIIAGLLTELEDNLDLQLNTHWPDDHFFARTSYLLEDGGIPELYGRVESTRSVLRVMEQLFRNKVPFKLCKNAQTPDGGSATQMALIEYGAKLLSDEISEGSKDEVIIGYAFDAVRDQVFGLRHYFCKPEFKHSCDKDSRIQIMDWEVSMASFMYSKFLNSILEETYYSNNEKFQFNGDLGEVERIVFMLQQTYDTINIHRDSCDDKDDFDHDLAAFQDQIDQFKGLVPTVKKGASFNSFEDMYSPFYKARRPLLEYHKYRLVKEEMSEEAM